MAANIESMFEIIKNQVATGLRRISELPAGKERGALIADLQSKLEESQKLFEGLQAQMAQTYAGLMRLTDGIGAIAGLRQPSPSSSDFDAFVQKALVYLVQQQVVLAKSYPSSEASLLAACRENNRDKVQEIQAQWKSYNIQSLQGLKVAIASQSIDVILFWMDYLVSFKQFSSITYADDTYPTLLLKLCSDDVFLPVLRGYVELQNKIGLVDALWENLTTSVNTSEKLKIILTEHPMARNCQIAELSPSRLAFQITAVRNFSYLADCATTIVKKNLGVTRLALLSPLAKAWLTIQEDQSLAGNNQELRALKNVVYYATFHYLVYHLQDAKREKGAKNASLFLADISACQDMQALLQCINKQILKLHASNDNASLRMTLVSHLITSEVFTQALLLEASNVPLHWKKPKLGVMENYSATLKQVLRFLAIQLDQAARLAFTSFTLVEPMLPTAALKFCVNQATRQYIQVNCFAGTDNDAGFRDAVKFWTKISACQSEPALFNCAADFLAERRSTAFKEYSHKYLVAAAMVKNPDLKALIFKDLDFSQVGDKNSQVKAVAGALKAYARSLVAVPTSQAQASMFHHSGSEGDDCGMEEGALPLGDMKTTTSATK
jgi:hypothetical protein